MSSQPPIDPVANPDIGEALLNAATAVIAERGVAGLTAERLATAAGCSRMTLHRRGITPAAVLAAMRMRAFTQLQSALAPALADTGNAAHRLRLAIGATLHVADEHLALLAGLFTDDDAIFHEAQALDAPVATADLFVAPFRRLLLDGALDGSLREVSDPTETAAVLFNAVGWTYVQLRWTQRWPADKSRRAIEALVLDGLAADR